MVEEPLLNGLMKSIKQKKDMPKEIKITPDKLKLEVDIKNNKLVLTEDVVYEIHNNHSVTNVIVPKGYPTDGASIPRIFWTVIGSPYQPRHLKAAIIHDYLYERHQGGRKARKEADEIFYYLLKKDGIKKITARIMWSALRLVARFFWYH